VKRKNVGVVAVVSLENAAYAKSENCGEDGIVSPVAEEK